MSSTSSNWPAVRIIHLTGGCRALSGLEGLLSFKTDTAPDARIEVQLASYGALYARLSSLGLAPIGIDFVSHVRKVKGIAPQDWRTYHPYSPTIIWPCQDEIDRYAQVGYAATKTGSMLLWDIARRISHQLRVCAWRLRQISEAYNEQLYARVASRNFRIGDRFEDSFTWLGYLSLQAFLVDACVLRYYLAEFYFHFACPDAILQSGPPVTSMGGLKKRVLDKISSNEGVTARLKTATEVNGWLQKLGSYRDLVVHCAPLASANKRLLALTSEIEIRGQGKIPAISMPIPDDPLAISKARSSGNYLSSQEAELRFFVEANRGSAPSMDGLLYCYIALDQLTRLAGELGKHSPVEPQIMHISADDTINGIRIIKDAPLDRTG